MTHAVQWLSWLVTEGMDNFVVRSTTVVLAVLVLMVALGLVGSPSP
jgi:hypothetical protein